MYCRKTSVTQLHFFISFADDRIQASIQEPYDLDFVVKYCGSASENCFEFRDSSNDRKRWYLPQLDPSAASSGKLDKLVVVNEHFSP